MISVPICLEFLGFCVRSRAHLTSAVHRYQCMRSALLDTLAKISLRSRPCPWPPKIKTRGGKRHFNDFAISALSLLYVSKWRFHYVCELYSNWNWSSNNNQPHAMSQRWHVVDASCNFPPSRLILPNFNRKAYKGQPNASGTLVQTRNINTREKNNLLWYFYKHKQEKKIIPQHRILIVFNMCRRIRHHHGSHFRTPLLYLPGTVFSLSEEHNYQDGQP